MVFPLMREKDLKELQKKKKKELKENELEKIRK